MKHDYPVAQLNENEVTELQETEQKIRSTFGKDIILIAYHDSERSETNG